MADNIVDVDDGNFENLVLKADKPVLVDFWAPWCGPCKAIGPVVAKLAETYGDQVLFSKCNVDDSREIPVKYGIKAVPTLMFFKNGDVVEKITGFVNQAKIEEAVKKVVAGGEIAAPFIVQ